MIAPDRGRVELDLHDSQPPLLLWYPPAALVALSERLGVDVSFSESQKFLIDLLTPKALVTFVWAGRIWEERDLRPESLRDRVGFTPRPSLEVVAVVRRALILALSGKDTGDDEAPEPVDPPKATVNGAGRVPSVSPSVN